MSKSTKGNGRVAGLLIPDSTMTVLLEYIDIYPKILGNSEYLFRKFVTNSCYSTSGI